MAFLDNSGDIILDAVLTDAGRQRMARGEFKITKFALGDEEINYTTFASSHPSGSAFADLEILQTPILEAFTNNTSLMKTKLLTINRNNLLYMPTLKVNTKAGVGTGLPITGLANGTDGPSDGIVLLADTTTCEISRNNTLRPKQGIHLGVPGQNFDTVAKYICIDQGIETAGDPPAQIPMPDDLIETAYLIRMDHRLLRLYGITFAADQLAVNGYTQKSNSFVDDDAIASYYISTTDGTVLGPPGSSGQTQRENINSATTDDVVNALAAEEFNGPLGPRLRLALKTSIHVQQSISLFNELGSIGSADLDTVGENAAGDKITSYKFIDTTINVVGVTTGYSIDIPVRIVKSTA